MQNLPIKILSARTGRLKYWLARLLLTFGLVSMLWWLYCVDIFLTGLRASVEYSFPLLFPRGFRSLEVLYLEGWLIHTGLSVRGILPIREFVFLLDREPHLYRTVMGIPLFWSLCLASVKPSITRLLLGTWLLWILCLVAVAGHIFGVLAAVLNGDSLALHIQGAPSIRVEGTPFSPVTAYLAGLGYNVSSLITPIIGPVLIWALLFSTDIKRLLNNQDVPAVIPKTTPVPTEVRSHSKRRKTRRTGSRS